MDGVDHDGDEVDLTGLMESIVDSDEEEDLAESIDVNGSFNFTPLCTRVFLSFVFLFYLTFRRGSKTTFDYKSQNKRNKKSQKIT